MPTSNVKEINPSARDISEQSPDTQPSADPPKCKGNKMKTIWKIFFYGIGSVLLILGVLITGFWEHLFHYFLKSKLILANSSSSESFTSWTGGNVPVYFNVYLFNVTNPLDIINGEKPVLEEVGPYVYRIKQLKDDITWNNNSTVTFRNRREWEFISEKSKGSLTDKVMSINAVALAFIYKCRKCLDWQKIILNWALKYNEKSPFVTYTVEDVLFAGAEDKMLSLLAIVKKLIKNFNLPDRFAWYWGKNLTEENYYNIFTGNEDINKLGLLNSWNYKTSCDVYEGECDVVKGSIGDLWPLNAAEGDKARLFISDFCSNFPLKNVGSNFVHDIKGIKFEGTKDLFNATSPDAACYCPGSKCNHKSGVRDVSACLKAPVFVSFPHFYLADKSYRSGVSGLNPDPMKHKFHITLQKDSGIVMDINARLQINLMIESVPGLDFIPISKVLLPILWFEEYADVPRDLVARLQFTFNTLPFWFSTTGLILAIAGSILLVSGFVIMRFSFESIPYTRRLD